MKKPCLTPVAVSLYPDEFWDNVKALAMDPILQTILARLECFETPVLTYLDLLTDELASAINDQGAFKAHHAEALVAITSNFLTMSEELQEQATKATRHLAACVAFEQEEEAARRRKFYREHPESRQASLYNA